MSDHQKRGGSQGVWWVIGAVLAIQGFGSAVTESQWGTSFGVAGLLRAAGLPQWSDLLIGAAGVVVLAVTAAKRSNG
jgi:hypothetical protein